MYANFIWVLVGSALIGAGASLVGSFTYLRKEALVGDAISHALLPGVALSFLITGEKSLWVLFPGAFLTGWLSLPAISAIRKYSKIKSDSAIAIVLSVFFAVGIVLLTHIQQGEYGNQSGLDAFLFGKAASMLPRDITLFAWVDVILIATITLLYPYLKAITFDREFAHAAGLPVKILSTVLSALTVLAVATGIQAVGVVLMAALVITPGAAARLFAKRLGTMLVTAMAIGVVSAVGGVFISSLAPSMPTGPWIVVVLSVIAILSFLYAPKRGIMARRRRKRRHARKISEENVLKLLYHHGESSGKSAFTVAELLSTRKFDPVEFESAVNQLIKKNRILRKDDRLSLTPEGLREATRVVRLHRLWELYLNERLNLPPDHVHHDAEAIEHIITPELEAALVAELGYPQIDPHRSAIPGVSHPHKNPRHE